MGRFATGVVIVTVADDAGATGFTCQAFMSLSLDPALVCVAPAKTSATWPRLAARGAFGVNIIGESQVHLARTFAGKASDKFATVRWRPGPTGSPIIADAIAWADCALEVSHDVGDHHLAIGRVVAVAAAETAERPLVFHRGNFVESAHGVLDAARL
jgi:flavin reductase (DIM6/NTAB) family NADH-FMN oxidoreductase RutF